MVVAGGGGGQRAGGDARRRRPRVEFFPRGRPAAAPRGVRARHAVLAAHGPLARGRLHEPQRGLEPHLDVERQGTTLCGVCDVCCEGEGEGERRRSSAGRRSAATARRSPPCWSQLCTLGTVHTHTQPGTAPSRELCAPLSARLQIGSSLLVCEPGLLGSFFCVVPTGVSASAGRIQALKGL